MRAQYADCTPEFFASRAGCGRRGRRIPSSSSACRAPARRCSSRSSRATPWSKARWSCRQLPQIARDLAIGQERQEDRSPRPWRAGVRTQLRALGERYLARDARRMRKTQAPFFIDKMPNNCFYVGLIHLILPNASIIDARRHPLGCCFSVLQAALRARPEFHLRPRGPRPLLPRLRRVSWRTSTRVLPGPVHRVIYEDMVEDTEAAGAPRCSTTAGCRSRSSACASTRTSAPCARRARSRCASRFSATGVDHWRHYEPWLGPLKAALWARCCDSYPAGTRSSLDEFGNL